MMKYKSIGEKMEEKIVKRKKNIDGERKRKTDTTYTRNPRNHHPYLNPIPH